MSIGVSTSCHWNFGCRERNGNHNKGSYQPQNGKKEQDVQFLKPLLQYAQPDSGQHIIFKRDGIRYPTDRIKSFRSELRPPLWQETLWLGSFKSEAAAMKAYDAALVYTGKSPVHFIYPVDYFLPLPPNYPSTMDKNDLFKYVKNLARSDMIVKRSEFKSILIKLAKEAAKRTTVLLKAYSSPHAARVENRSLAPAATPMASRLTQQSWPAKLALRTSEASDVVQTEPPDFFQKTRPVDELQHSPQEIVKQDEPQVQQQPSCVADVLSDTVICSPESQELKEPIQPPCVEARTATQLAHDLQSATSESVTDLMRADSNEGISAFQPEHCVSKSCGFGEGSIRHSPYSYSGRREESLFPRAKTSLAEGLQSRLSNSSPKCCGEALNSSTEINMLQEWEVDDIGKDYVLGQDGLRWQGFVLGVDIETQEADLPMFRKNSSLRSSMDTSMYTYNELMFLQEIEGQCPSIPPTFIILCKLFCIAFGSLHSVLS
jgi:hypothetical protein